jgi:hypothetical protein
MTRVTDLLRTLARVTCAAALALVPLAAAGCEEGTGERKGPATPVDPAEAAKIEAGKKLLAEADDALADKNFDKARKALKKALAVGVESQRYQIEEALEKVDKKHAKLWANEVDDDFKNKNCTAALKQLKAPLEALSESEAFTRELRRLVGQDALTCLQESIDQKAAAGDYAGARKLAADEQVKVVLGPQASKQLAAALEATILEALKAKIDGDLKARRWEKAAEKIEAFEKKGDAAPEQVEALLEGVREGVAPEIAQLATRTLGQKDAPAALKQIDQMAKVARWAIVDLSTAALSAGKALPEALTKKREALAIWVEAQRLGLRAGGKPEQRWAHGKVPVHPASKADAPSNRDIAHAAKVWIIGVGRDKALVTTEDPQGAKLAELLEKAAGWAEAHHLVREDPTDWLLPDEQLKGQRVWGPLRAGEPMWELGVVMDIAGQTATVQRLADGQNFKIPRSKLRSGRLSPGTKVLTFCVAKDQPAVVVEVPPANRTAKLKCDGGQEKEDDLASLRSKPELLPPTR